MLRLGGLAFVWLACCGPAVAEEKFLGRTADAWSERLAASAGQERVQAAWALAQLAGRSSGGPSDHVLFAELVKVISDSDAKVRYWGVRGFQSFAQQLPPGDGGRSGAINTLAPLLEDQSPAPRIAAAAALGQLGQAEKALPVLVTAMSDPQEATRMQAAAALGQLGPAARPAEQALRAATTDASAEVRNIAERALARLGATGK